MYAIEAADLTRTYGDAVAVDHISFTVQPGEIFGFLGPNGAGKTTTIRMLTGQLRPTAGSARVCGFDVATQRNRLKPAIGVVFEHHNLYERLTAYENLRFSARLYGVNGNRVAEMLQQVGLAEDARKQAKKFSSGIKQRLLIARALLHRPQVLFLNEPTKGLDPAVARDLRGLILDLKQQGVTIFLTTHYMEEADRLCDRVAILEHGCIIAMDAPSQLKAASAQPGATLEDVYLTLTGRSLAR